MSRILNLVIAEPSSIIAEGLMTILVKSNLKCNITVVDAFDELQQHLLKKNADIIIINPSLISLIQKSYNTIKSNYCDTFWIGLVYAYYDQQLLSNFDALINISDSPETIKATVVNILTTTNEKQEQPQDVLSDRETDVLKLLATGMSNKEIADKLNISINTVITHRKNISQKTGIKTVSGLTIYAVVKKLISLDNVVE